MAEGCKESFDWNFIKWIWIYPKKFKPLVLALIEKYGEGRKVFVLKNKKDLKNLLNECRTPVTPAN